MITTFYSARTGPSRRPAHRRGVPPRAGATAPARHRRQAEQRHRRRGQRVLRAGPGQGLGRRGQRGHRRHQVDTYIDNLLAETSIAMAGPAGSRTTTSPTPTSPCSPGSSPAGCGRPSTSSTGGCSSRPGSSRPRCTPTRRAAFPVFALAHLFGFELMPRIRNWKDLNFYRPAAAPATGTSTPCSASPAATSSTGT